MQGMTSGVKITSSGQPGSGSAIQIRGIGSFTGNSPLFIVDGSYGGSELGLNVDDIESIQVLKDASSAAIYGSRAASGVVIITTKKGKAGPLKVTGDASAQLYWLPRYDLMDAETYKLYDDRAYEEAMLQGVAGVTKTQNHFDGDTDWQSEMLRTGLLQNYNVALSGGNNDIRYYVSANHKQYLYGDVYGLLHLYKDIFSTKLNVSYKNYFGENFFFTKSNTQKLNTATGWIWSNFIAMPPTIPVYDESHPGGYGYGDPDRANTYALNPVGYEELYHAENGQQYLYGDVYGLLAVSLRGCIWLAAPLQRHLLHQAERILQELLRRDFFAPQEG